MWRVELRKHNEKQAASHLSSLGEELRRWYEESLCLRSLQHLNRHPARVPQRITIL